MIAWVVDFTSRMVERYPDSLDPLAEPAVVLVDEIDLHLHPKWQRELIGFLSERFPKHSIHRHGSQPLDRPGGARRQSRFAPARG